MRRTAESAAFTVVEAILWALALIVITGLAASAVHWTRLSWTSGVERLDQFGALRLASLKISQELAYARQLLYPPVSPSGAFHQVLFLGQHNQLEACFVDPQKRLMLLTRDAVQRVEPLTRQTIRLDVRRPGVNYLEYMVTIADEQGRELRLGNGIWVKNHD
ncbi:MAG: hypothetical protein HY816_10050 [Candidatus Wallbacteria bacterium]|nr:hypothetical protein [Candidatus Wallbacteria bacterium]